MSNQRQGEQIFKNKRDEETMRPDCVSACIDFMRSACGGSRIKYGSKNLMQHLELMRGISAALQCPEMCNSQRRNGYMDGWTDRQTDKQMYGLTIGQTDGLTGRQAEGRKDKCTDADGPTDRQMDG